MKVFRGLRDKEFICRFSECLSIDRLLKTAIPLPEKHISEKFAKECCFDFSGISASILHDRTDENVRSVQDNFRNLLEKKAFFERERIRLHFRFLLVYPYSGHAIARIQAEFSRNRGTIREPQGLNFGVVEPVNRQMFENSNFLATQKEFLKHIRNLMEAYGITGNSYSRIVIRFIPMAVNICMYRINDIIFTTPYLLAKEWRVDTKCVIKSPVTEISRNEDLGEFEVFLDHFRYLWQMPQAIYVNDVTDYLLKNDSAIPKIKSPDDIDFKEKVKKVKEKNIENYDSWKHQVRNLLKQQCPVIPEHLTKKERVFIACSWQQLDYSPASPNLLADKLTRYLRMDFASNIEVAIVNAPVGATLKEEIYENLHASTVGIIILTADYKDDHGNWYSKPNIYHELGYLMASTSCERYSEKYIMPIILIKQRKNKVLVSTPSNAAHIVSIDLEEDMLEGIYAKIITSIQSMLGFDTGNMCRALKSHKKRIEDMIIKGSLNSAIAKPWIAGIENEISEYSCKDCDMSNCSHRSESYFRT